MAAMSGGVDSTVAALLLREQGFAASGVHLRLLRNEDLGLDQESGCCSLADAEEARTAAYRLGLPFYVFDFSQTFRDTVILNFVRGYEAGETPNPCIDCNRFVKFGRLLMRAKTLGYDYLATGHYARIERDEACGRWLLRRGADGSKDQSYFLAMLTQEQLAHTLLPLGGLHKTEVRALAADAGFHNAAKRDSQDLCFAPDGDYAAFLERVTGRPAVPGDFVDGEGRVLGRHRGLIRYTPGQRRGLAVSAGRPVYVCRLCPDTNTVVLGGEEALQAGELTAREVNWIAVPTLTEPRRVTVQIRSRQTEQLAVAVPLPDGRLRVIFDAPQRAVTPGQAVVLYEGDTVLGAGIIERG